MEIYLISGKARSGKDTFAGYLKNELESKGKKVCKMHIGGYLKDLIRKYFDWDGSDETKPRTLMQHLGTEIIRVKMGKEYYYINRLVEDIEILSNFYDTFIISDIRLPIEFTEIKKNYPNSIKIHITRPDFQNELSEKEQKHITETALDNYQDYDYEIINSSLENLEKDAKKMAEEVEK